MLRGFSRKKILLIASVAILAIVLIVIFIIQSSGDKSIDPRSDVRTDLMYPATSQSDIDKAKSLVNRDLTYDIVTSNPSAYKNEVIQWPAKVFTSPENDGGTVYLQAYAEESDKPYVISYTNPSFEVKEGDYLLVTGVVAGLLDGENAFGASANRVAIKANYVEKSDRVGVFAPEIDSKVIDQKNTQNNFTVTADKIVRSKNETRLYVSIKNDSSHEVSFYTGSTKIVQNGKQYEEESNYDDTRLPSSYKPGVSASGYITFPALDNLDNLKMYLDEPYASGQYDLNWQEIVLDIK